MQRSSFFAFQLLSSGINVTLCFVSSSIYAHNNLWSFSVFFHCHSNLSIHFLLTCPTVFISFHAFISKTSNMSCSPDGFIPDSVHPRHSHRSSSSASWLFFRTTRVPNQQHGCSSTPFLHSCWHSCSWNLPPPPSYLLVHASSQKMMMTWTNIWRVSIYCHLKFVLICWISLPELPFTCQKYCFWWYIFYFLFFIGEVKCLLQEIFSRKVILDQWMTGFVFSSCQQRGCMRSIFKGLRDKAKWRWIFYGCRFPVNTVSSIDWKSLDRNLEAMNAPNHIGNPDLHIKKTYINLFAVLFLKKLLW